MLHCGCDGDKGAVGRRDIAAAVVIISPFDYGAISFETEAVVKGSSDRDEILVRQRDIALAIIIFSPGDN